MSARATFLDVPGVAPGVRVLTGNMLENGGVVDGLCVYDFSYLGNTSVGVSDCGGTGVVGVKGGVSPIVVDEDEIVRCLLERGCADNKFVVDIESAVAVEPRLSNRSV